MKNILLLLLVSLTLACSTSDKPDPEVKMPNKIIFLIGDGMGLSAVSTGFYYGDQPSVFSRFQEIGLQQTSSAKQKVTDSAASGTAMATGGWSTGVVATSTISHATPASFYAHVIQRAMEEEIANQLLDSEIDFFAGGGRDKFEHRRDSIDLLSLAADKGFTIDTTGLPAPGTLSGDMKYGFLPEATMLAISYLNQNQKGFFLMVEGSQIDWASHTNNTDYLVGEMLDFEKVIAAALDFATDDHSATLIPVFAFGPGAEKFKGIYQNTEIIHKMVALVKGE